MVAISAGERHRKGDRTLFSTTRIDYDKDGRMKVRGEGESFDSDLGEKLLDPKKILARKEAQIENPVENQIAFASWATEIGYEADREIRGSRLPLARYTVLSFVGESSDGSVAEGADGLMITNSANDSPLKRRFDSIIRKEAADDNMREVELGGIIPEKGEGLFKYGLIMEGGDVMGFFLRAGKMRHTSTPTDALPIPPQIRQKINELGENHTLTQVYELEALQGSTLGELIYARLRDQQARSSDAKGPFCSNLQQVREILNDPKKRFEKN